LLSESPGKCEIGKRENLEESGKGIFVTEDGLNAALHD
jgi:hypothetical protein